jgi:DNA-directed RNA polymerase subunit RPC12/RpoP
MMRLCSQCGKEFTPQELDREDSKGMESERKALGLEGVLFRYYTCSACGRADIFVDVRPLEGESEGEFRRRTEELEATLKQLEGEGVEVVVSARK